MAFIRRKIINGNTYYYLVESFWTENGSRQRVLKYLGKAKTVIKEGPLFFRGVA